MTLGSLLARNLYPFYFLKKEMESSGWLQMASHTARWVEPGLETQVSLLHLMLKLGQVSEMDKVVVDAFEFLPLGF